MNEAAERGRRLRVFGALGVVILGLVVVMSFPARWFLLGSQQEGRALPLMVAALRLHIGHEPVVRVSGEPEMYLSYAAMEHPSGDWPFRKWLQQDGHVFVEQLGGMTAWKKPDGSQTRFIQRMFTREMIVASRVP